MMANFYHLLLLVNNEASVKRIPQVMGLAFDWIEYGPSCFLIYSDKDAGAWQVRLNEAIGSDGMFFICKLDVHDRAGMMPKGLWDWITEKQNLEQFKVGDAVYLWALNEPSKVYLGVIKDKDAHGKPSVMLPGIITDFKPGSGVVFSKADPRTGQPIPEGNQSSFIGPTTTVQA